MFCFLALLSLLKGTSSKFGASIRVRPPMVAYGTPPHQGKILPPLHLPEILPPYSKPDLRTPLHLDFFLPPHP